MRPKYKNELFKALIDNALGFANFKFEEDLTIDSNIASKITFLENGKISPFDFVIREAANQFGLFDCKFIEYSPLMDYTSYYPENDWAEITEICGLLPQWIKNIESYLEDKNVIDLWAEYSKTDQFQQNAAIDFQDRSAFTYDEKQQVLIGLQNLKISINQHFEVSEQQAKLIGDGIQYLAEGIDRLNKLDWKSILVGQFFTVATALASNPHQFDSLYNMFMKVIQIIPVLPMPK
ncbi:MAG: hypothetical protein V4560_02570 [Bacteroidota bacterium]